MTLTIIDKDNVLLMRINVDKVCVIDDNERKILLISLYP